MFDFVAVLKLYLSDPRFASNSGTSVQLASCAETVLPQLSFVYLDDPVSKITYKFSLHRSYIDWLEIHLLLTPKTGAKFRFNMKRVY